MKWLCGWKRVTCDKYPSARHNTDLGESARTGDRIYKLSQETTSAIRRLEAEFQPIFRRQMREDDLMFFPSVLYSEEDFLDYLAEVMESADISPELQYATLKTRRIVTHDNMKYLDEEELAEWNEAIEEFRRAASHHTSTPEQADFEFALDRLVDEFHRLPLIFAYYLHQLPRTGETTKIDIGEFASLFCATKTLKTLKASVLLLDRHFGEDALLLARSIFENYLQIIFSLVEPTKHQEWVEAKIGVKTGSHRFRTRPNGKTDYKEIIHVLTGRGITSTSLQRMAKMSPFQEDAELYSLLYGMMSEYAHSSPTVAVDYFDDGWFNTTDRKMATTAGLLCHMMTFLVLDAFLQMDKAPTIFHRDVHVFLGFTRRKLKTCFRHSELLKPLKPLELALRQRLSHLGRTWPQ